jgi:hypothetical protein
MYKQEKPWYNRSMLIYTNQSSKKRKHKPTAKQRELAASWDALLKKYEPKKVLPKVAAVKAPKPYVRETPHYPSLNSGYHDCTKKQQHHYTGDKMLGIGTLHKSNAVPVFSSDDAKEISRMRRG